MSRRPRTKNSSTFGTWRSPRNRTQLVPPAKANYPEAPARPDRHPQFHSERPFSGRVLHEIGLSHESGAFYSFCSSAREKPLYREYVQKSTDSPLPCAHHLPIDIKLADGKDYF